jgi:hypothetical protein
MYLFVQDSSDLMVSAVHGACRSTFPDAMAPSHYQSARINALRLFGSYQKLLLVAYIIQCTASTELHPNEGCLLVIEKIALLGKPL